MPAELMESIAPLIALLGVGTFTLVGMKIWLRAKTERMTMPGAKDTEQLMDAVETLHEQVQLLREEFGELHERVDFAERLLSRAGVRDGGGDPPARE